MDITEPTAHGDLVVAPVSVAPARPGSRFVGGRRDRIYHGITLVVALNVAVILLAIAIVLVATAWPAFGRLGFGFLVGTVWNPTIGVYGALLFIVGTLLTTGLALLIAVPISLAIAILLSDYLPRRAASVLSVVIDVAAGVPTIVFGAWALLALIPWLRDTVEPAIAAVLGWFPPLDPNNSPVGITGYGMFSAGLVLAAMIFPTIVSISRTSLQATPPEMREAALGLGSTRWEVATRVVVRQGRNGILGAIILACGRALGETMAVVYIIGTVPRLPQSLFDEGYSLSAELLTQVYGGGAIPGTLVTAALYELGLILLALSLLTGIAGRALTQGLGHTALLGGGR